jgi:Leucine-rich repeat (LRR) protein
MIIFRAILPIEIGSEPPPEPCSFKVRQGMVTLIGEEAQAVRSICHCEFTGIKIKRSRNPRIPDCKSLKEVHLIKTELESFPLEILKHEGLEFLTMRFVGLTHLPHEIAELKSLRVLDLRGNGITSLPEGLDHLERIDLRLNDINRKEQEAMRARYPDVDLFFSSPCQCH